MPDRGRTLAGILAAFLAVACAGPGHGPGPSRSPDEGVTTGDPDVGREDPVASLPEDRLGEFVPSAGRRPDAVLLLTGRDTGEVGPCGCVARPGGGLARKAAFARLLRRVWPGVPVSWFSVGDFSGDPTPAGRIRTRALSRAMKDLGYGAVNLGPRELEGGLDAYLRDVAGSGIPVLTTNLSVRPDPTAPGPVTTSMEAPLQRVLTVGRLRIGVIGLSAPPHGQAMITARDPREAAAAAAASLRPNVDFLLALAVLPYDTAVEVARAAPSLDLLFAGWGSRVTAEPFAVGAVPVLFGGDRGRWLVEVRLFAGERGMEAAEFFAHYLGEEVPPDPRFLAVEKEAAIEVREAQRRRAAEAAAAAPRPEGEGFVSARSCAPCHQAAAHAWEASPHAAAFRTLVAADRDFDPECLSCHTTGYGRPGGFTNPVRDSDLAGVQCEACHGPGRRHLSETSAPWPAPPVPAMCTGCHDSDNDPDFDPRRAWAAVAH